jgi:hypothetical protein
MNTEPTGMKIYRGKWRKHGMPLTGAALGEDPEFALKTLRSFTVVRTDIIEYVKPAANLVQCLPFLLKKHFLIKHILSKHIIMTINHQQMHKENFIINCNTLLHVSTLLGHLQGELFVIVTQSLHFVVE